MTLDDLELLKHSQGYCRHFAFIYFCQFCLLQLQMNFAVFLDELGRSTGDRRS